MPCYLGRFARVCKTDLTRHCWTPKKDWCGIWGCVWRGKRRRSYEATNVEPEPMRGALQRFSWSYRRLYELEWFATCKAIGLFLLLRSCDGSTLWQFQQRNFDVDSCARIVSSWNPRIWAWKKHSSQEIFLLVWTCIEWQRSSQCDTRMHSHSFHHGSYYTRVAEHDSTFALLWERYEILYGMRKSLLFCLKYFLGATFRWYQYIA